MKNLQFQLWQMSKKLCKHHETMTRQGNPYSSKQKVQMESPKSALGRERERETETENILDIMRTIKKHASSISKDF